MSNLFTLSFMHLPKFFFLLLLSFFRFSATAQTYWENHEMFTTASGLPNNAVLSIAQDDHQLLWIGTRNGLCIYDGYEFEVRRDLFGVKEGEWGNFFCTLFKDREGNMWVATQSGRIARYDRQADSFISYSIRSNAHKGFISCCYQDMSGTIWMGSNNGELYALQKNSMELTAYPSVSGYQNINFITEDYSGDLWINGYYRFIPPYKNGKANRNKQPLFLKTTDKKIEIHKKNGKVVAISKNEIVTKRNYVLCVTQNDRLLVGTAQLLKEFDNNGNLLSRIVLNNDGNDNSEDVANCLFKDATGICWLGTNSGLIKIDKDKYRFAKFSVHSLYGKLNSNYIRSVFVDTNTVWVGFKSGKVNRLSFDSKAKKYTSISCSYSSPTNAFLAINIIRKLRSGIFLFGGADGLFYATGATGNEPMLHDLLLRDSKKTVKLEGVWSIYEDRKGHIWTGTRSKGLYIIEPATRKYRHYPYTHTTSTPGGLTPVSQVFEDHKGDVWLATENGLDSVIIGVDGYPADFYSINDHYKGDAGRQVWSVVEDNKNRMWISTTINGISMVDKNRQQFITYNKSNGLPGDVVCGMLADPKGHLWISTLNGISRFDVEKRTFLHFTESDGLPGNDFNFNACYRAPSGHLFFGSKSGMVSFHPDSIAEQKTTEVPVLVRAFNLGGEKYLNDPDPGKPIILNHDQNSFSFRFALPHFASPQSHRYQYTLEGFEDNWVATDARHPIATYTNIPPGNYRLLVRGSLNGQRWGKPSQLSIIVKPAFWQRSLFRIAVIILLVTAVVYIVYSRFKNSIAKEREKSRTQQQFAELEFRALQSQMNPHFIFNSINAIQHFMLTNDEETANDYLSKFARLMRLYLESSKNKYISLQEEVELLQLYVHLEKLRFDDKFNFTFSVDPYFEHTTLEIPSMLLQPYVENAINHGLALRSTQGTLNINFIPRPGGICCIIEDNGVGRAYTEKNKTTHHRRSRGTDLIKERLNAYRLVDDIEIKAVIIDKTDSNGNAIGTRVEIFIPN